MQLGLLAQSKTCCDTFITSSSWVSLEFEGCLFLVGCVDTLTHAYISTADELSSQTICDS